MHMDIIIIICCSEAIAFMFGFWILKSNLWSKLDGDELYILTIAEATCLAMVNMRLSVISHGGFTFSFKPPPTKKAEIVFITWINTSYTHVCACVIFTCV